MSNELDDNNLNRFLATSLGGPSVQTGNDLEGNPLLPSPGETIDSPWGQSVVVRAVPRFSSAAVRDASLLAPDQGQLAYVLEVDELQIWDGASWIQLGSGVFLPLAGGRLTGELLIADGSPTFPGIGFDSNEGLYRPATNQMSFVIGGENVLLMRSDYHFFGNAGAYPIIKTDGGSDALPSYSFQGHAGTGQYYTTLWGFSWEGATRFFINGNGPHFPGVETTGSAANAFLNAGASERLQRSTSARKYKSNIVAAPQLADIDLEPVTFHHDGDDQDYVGFIADDIAAGVPEAGVYIDGEVENYDVRAVAAILAAKVNDLEARLATLEAR